MAAGGSWKVWSRETVGAVVCANEIRCGASIDLPQAYSHRHTPSTPNRQRCGFNVFRSCLRCLAGDGGWLVALYERRMEGDITCGG